MANPRQNKILINIWLIKSEWESLRASLDGETDMQYCEANILEIIQNAFNKGDIERR